MEKTTNDSNQGRRGMDIVFYKDIESNLVNIFPDAIIIDTRFNMVDMSGSILHLLGYKKEQLIHKSLSEVIGDDFEEISKVIHKGYFVHSKINLKDSKGKKIKVFLSGYFLGLISDINGKIILLIRNCKEPLKDKRKDERRYRIINQIIYRSSHDIRGPLSTIKGLIQLALLENDEAVVNEYLDKVNISVDKLDFKLNYIRESINRENFESQYISMQDLLSSISSRLIKFRDTYNFNVFLKVTELDLIQPFSTSRLFVSFFIENLLLVLDSVNEMEGSEYLIEIRSDKVNLIMTVHNRNIFLRMQNHFGDILGYKSMKNLLNTDNYNYLNLRILKVCQEVVNAKLVVDEAKPSEITIVIPSHI